MTGGWSMRGYAQVEAKEDFATRKHLGHFVFCHKGLPEERLPKERLPEARFPKTTFGVA